MAVRKTQRTVLFTRSLFRAIEKYKTDVNESRGKLPPVGYGKAIQNLAEKGLKYVKLEKGMEDGSCLLLDKNKAVSEYIRWKHATPALLEFIRDNNLEQSLFSYLREGNETVAEKRRAALCIRDLIKKYDHAPGFMCPSEEEKDSAKKEGTEASP